MNEMVEKWWVMREVELIRKCAGSMELDYWYSMSTRLAKMELDYWYSMSTRLAKKALNDLAFEKLEDGGFFGKKI